MCIALSAKLTADFDQAVQRTRDALLANGFGVLTEIDIKATLHTRLGVHMEDYLILGACDPALANRAISLDREIGLLLPCNVVVRADPDEAGTVMVDAMDPSLLIGVTGEPALMAIAEEVTAKLGAAISLLASGSG